VNLGDTFILWPEKPIHKEHLFVVMTDPSKNGARFATVNLTRSKHGPKAVTFKVGEHPFIVKYDSDANYADAMITTESTGNRQITWGQAVMHQPMAMDMMRRIATGAINHPAIDGEVEEMIRVQWSL
jgi:hypothetical protein